MSIGRSVVWLSLRCSSGSLIEEDLGKCYCCCSYCCVYSLNFFSFPHPIFSFFICVTPGHTPLSQSHLLQLYVRLWRAHVYLHYDLTAPSSFCNILYNPFCQDTLIWLLLLIDETSGFQTFCAQGTPKGKPKSQGTLVFISVQNNLYNTCYHSVNIHF